MGRHTTVKVLAASVFLLAGCSDRPEPLAPSDATDAGLSRSAAQVSPDDPNALARGVRGFGGFFFDAEGMPTIYLKEVAQRGNAERALGPYLRAEGIGPAQLRVRRGDFDYAELERWSGQATVEV
ncbi:MAG: hypothetical protein ACREMG_03570, partial [Gemmatimonadales bacterium]